MSKIKYCEIIEGNIKAVKDVELLTEMVRLSECNGWVFIASKSSSLLNYLYIKKKIKQ